MEHTKDIGQIITEALSSVEVKSRVEEFGDISENNVEEIVLYCQILQNSKIPKELLKIWGEKEFADLIVKQVAEKLGINEECIEKQGNVIFEYIYNKLIENGFAYHMTNSVLAEEIKQNGLKPVGKTPMADDINDVVNIIQKYGKDIKNDLFPYVSREIADEAGFCYTTIPCRIGTYFFSPEWLKCFCLGTAILADRRETGNAFLTKDYQSVIENINILIEKYDIAEEDAKVLKSFFNKYWRKFEKTTPTLVLMPQECFCDNPVLRTERLKEYYKEIREEIVDTSDIDEELESKFEDMQENARYKYYMEKWAKETIEKRIKESKSVYCKVCKLIERYHSASTINGWCKRVISPEYLSFADVSELVQKEYRTTLRVTKESGMISFDELAKDSLKKGATQKDVADAKYVESQTYERGGVTR